MVYRITKNFLRVYQIQLFYQKIEKKGKKKKRRKKGKKKKKKISKKMITNQMNK